MKKKRRRRRNSGQEQGFTEFRPQHPYKKQGSHACLLPSAVGRRTAETRLLGLWQPYVKGTWLSGTGGHPTSLSGLCTCTPPHVCIHLTHTNISLFFSNIRGTKRHFRMYFTSHMLRLKHICLVTYTAGYSFSLVYFVSFLSFTL